MLPAICVIVLPDLPVSIAVGDMLTTIVVFPALFWAAAIAVTPRAAGPWLDWLGALSFPLYAIHLPILELAASIDSTAPSMMLAIAGTLLAAFLIAHGNAALLARRKGRTMPIRSAAPASG